MLVSEAVQPLQRPREQRREVELPAVALFSDGSPVRVTVLDLSYDGCRIATTLAMLPGIHFNLSVLGLGRMAANVRWYANGFAGVSFRSEPAELDPRTPRKDERKALNAKVLLRRAGRKNYEVQATDLSPSGCKVEFVDRPLVAECHWIKFANLDALEAEVRWVNGHTAGLEFVRPIYPAVFELLLAKLGS